MSFFRKVYRNISGDVVRNFDWHDEFEVYRCSKCGWVTSAAPEGAIGTAHAHAERHTGFFSMADFEKLDRFIHKINVTDFKEADYENE